ncbi:MAG: phage terminase small subunit P27 family [Oscillospiraceae bacterium]|nr:phage terminase small subunit P27 family [Oscillospiraceae bacterium]
MPSAVKRSENLVKHLTQAQREARQQAEEEVLPDRGREPQLVKPAIMTRNAAAGRYWRNILARMEGLDILDDLDSDALGVYCVMLARYEAQCKLLTQAANQLKAAEGDPEEIAEAAGRLDAASGKMQSLERNLLQYAEKLGLTPSGRVRLAQKRAEQAAKTELDGDLFGD